MSKFITWLKNSAISLLTTVLVTLFNSLLIMVLWNLLMPNLFHVPSLSWLQAWGLTILASLFTVNVRSQINS